ncbi:MAG: GNAT family N-acetyltransferase [Deltaproteobacteria bacterium]|nr:GNAT family N-acetyltransferase [Nannocystaceae bacterium]
MWLPIEGARLRAFRRGDEHDLVVAADDREIWRNVRDAFPHPYTREDAERWVAYNEGLAPVLNFAIELDDRVVGGLGLVLGQDVHRYSAELGYWLARAVWGRGLATAAVRALVRYAFEELELVRLHAGVFVWNPASARVLEKSGFERECLMRSWAFKDGELVDAWAYACVRPR